MIFQIHSENMRKCGYGGIGRRAGFRYQWASRAGSSPVIRIHRRSTGEDGTFSVLQRKYFVVYLIYNSYFAVCYEGIE